MNFGTLSSSFVDKQRLLQQKAAIGSFEKYSPCLCLFQRLPTQGERFGATILVEGLSQHSYHVQFDLLAEARDPFEINLCPLLSHMSLWNVAVGVSIGFSGAVVLDGEVDAGKSYPDFSVRRCYYRSTVRFIESSHDEPAVVSEPAVPSWTKPTAGRTSECRRWQRQLFALFRGLATEKRNTRRSVFNLRERYASAVRSA